LRLIAFFVVKPNRIRLFIKPYCPWCHRAREWLAARQISYQELDVISEASAFDEMRRLSGQDQAPVIEVDGKVLADFGPEELSAFWKQFDR